MITQQLLDYIREQQAAGKNPEEVKTQLRAAGWQEAHIEEGMKAVQSGQTVAPAAPAAALPKAWEIFREAWQIYKVNLWKLLGISIIPIAAIAIIGFLLGLAGLAGRGAGEPSAAVSGALLIGILVAVIALIYLGVWSAVSLLVFIRDRHENLAIKEAYNRSKPFIGKFFTTNLLSGLAVLGGFILFIVPGIIFALWFSQASYVVTSEGKTNREALGQSKAYVKGRLGTVFGKLFFIGFITWIIFIVLGIGLGTSGLMGTEERPNFAGNLVIQIANFVWAPVVTVYGYLLYEYLKRSKIS